MKRVRQETMYYCGPAVLQMLLNFKAVDRSQRSLVDAAEIHHKIAQYGMYIDELAKAVERSAPEYQFWHKHYSTIDELSRLVNEFNYPVGVAWQGVFDYDDDDDEEEEEEGQGDDDDPGHYSVVTHISKQENVVQLSDPFKYYAGTDRKFTVLEFERRWWDINDAIDPVTGKKYQQDDYHTMFIITRKSEDFPAALGMVRGGTYAHHSGVITSST